MLNPHKILHVFGLLAVVICILLTTSAYAKDCRAKGSNCKIRSHCGEHNKCRVTFE